MVKFYLCGTLVYIEVNVKLRVFEHRVFVIATVFSYDSKLKEKSNFPLHNSFCQMHTWANHKPSYKRLSEGNQSLPKHARYCPMLRGK